MTYKYDSKKFNANQDWVIRKACMDKVNMGWLDFITRTNPDGTPIYDHDQMEKILDGFKDGLSKNDINIYAATTNFNGIEKAIFDSNQMIVICKALKEKVDKSKIDVLTKLNSNNQPIFSYNQMKEISFAFKLTEDQINFIAKLNNNEEAIYNYHQMCRIRIGMEMGLSQNEIDIFAKIIDDKPVFTLIEMEIIENFIKKVRDDDYEKVQQIKECVDEGLKYEQIEPFINPDIPAENIRILKSFYSLECEADEILEILKNKPNYKELKEIKYLLQCAEQLDIWPNEIMCDKIVSLNSIKENLTQEILNNYFIEGSKGKQIIEKCLSYKMPPEQIEYIAESYESFAENGMENIAIGFLNGLTTEEMKNIVKRHDIDDELDKLIDSITEDIEDAIRVRIYSIFGVGSDVKFKTDWFDEMER